MITNNLENNYITLVGKVTSDKEFSHEIYGEKFYVFNLNVPRLSGNADTIPITISERLIEINEVTIGKVIKIEGQFRSYNSYIDQRSKLILTVFVKTVEILDIVGQFEPTRETTSNKVTLVGYICKQPVYRTTPFGREIADILLAVNRAYNKSDYIPCIAWGRNARFCESMPVGTEVKVVGRVQSRAYEKKYDDGTEETKIAYEVSIANLEVLNKSEEENDVNASSEEAME